MSTLQVNIGIAGRDTVKRNLQSIRSDLKKFKAEVESIASKTPTVGLGDEKKRAKEEAQILKGLAAFDKACQRIDQKRHKAKLAQIKEEERARLQSEKKQARENARKDREAQGFRKQVAGQVTGAVGRTVNRVATVGKGLALAGVAGIGASVAKEINVRGQIADIANQAAGTNGEKRSTNQIASDVEGLTNRTAISNGVARDDVLGGIRSGVGITGELKTVEGMVPQMADLATATGSDFKDLMEGMSKSYNVMSRTMSKGDALAKSAEVMKALAQQANMGSVELKDYADIIGDIAASASKFKGDAGGLITGLSAIGQYGAPSIGSSAEIATSLARIPDDIVSHLKKLNAFGVKTTVDNGTALRDPTEIIIDTLKKTKGKLAPLADVFDVRSMKAINPLRAKFAEASGGKTDAASLEKGAQAVRDALAPLQQAILTQQDIEEKKAFRMAQTDKQLDVVMTRLQVVFGERFLPVFEKSVLPVLENQIVPSLVSIAPALAEFSGDVLSFVSKHPLEALGSYMALSVAKDIAGAGLGKAIGLAMTGEIAKAGLAASVGGALAAAIAAIVTGYHMGGEAADELGAPGMRAQEIRTEVAESGLNGRPALGASDLQARLAELQTLKDRTSKTEPTTFQGVVGGVSSALGGQSAEQVKDSSMKSLDVAIKTLSDALAKNTAATLANSAAPSTARTDAGSGTRK